MTTVDLALELDSLQFDERGLITVVVQDTASATVLMVAWANREALELTLATGRAHFFSRSRQSLWRKGETSNNELVVREIYPDCDRDTLLVRAEPLGPTCHTGVRSCFDRCEDPDRSDDSDCTDASRTAGSRRSEVPTRLELGWLSKIVAQRAAAADTEASYTARLLRRGIDRVAQKVGEEAVETVIAALRYQGERTRRGTGGADDSDDSELSPSAVDELRAEFVGEGADLLFHLVVLLQATGVSLDEIAGELTSRHQAARKPVE